MRHSETKASTINNLNETTFVKSKKKTIGNWKQNNAQQNAA